MKICNFVNQVISSGSLVLLLILLIGQRETLKRVAILDRAVRNVPGDVKTTLTADPRKVERIVPRTDPVFDDVHGTWFSDQIDGDIRPHIVISPNGFIVFGIERNVYWACGQLEAGGNREWKMDATRFINRKGAKEMAELGKLPIIRFKLEDGDQLRFTLESDHGLTKHFANNGEVFKRWTMERQW